MWTSYTHNEETGEGTAKIVSSLGQSIQVNM